MSIKHDVAMHARHEVTKLLSMIDKLLDATPKSYTGQYDASQLTAAVKRKSMDVTRILTQVRAGYRGRVL